MRKKIIFSVILGLFLLAFLVFSAPAKAMAPPPATNIWLWTILNTNRTKARQVKVEVTWQENGPQKAEMSSWLRDLR